MNWELACLIVVALASIVTAAFQAVLLLETARLARQAAATVEQMQREIQPLLVKAHRIADDASRATSLALTQIERADRVMTATVTAVDDAVSAIQGAVIQPLKSGPGLIRLLQVVWTLFRSAKGTKAAREDEDAMFVG